MEQIQVLVIDLGSQYAKVIGRTLGELNYRSAILPPTKAKSWLEINKPKAIILSGGSASIYESHSPKPPEEILSMGIPILGICYGMQWMVNILGGVIGVEREKKEYGKIEIIYYESHCDLFADLDDKKVIWTSHGDSIITIPDGFSILAKSNNNQTIAAIGSTERKMWGLQFHPEVTHTDDGKDILQNFLSKICNCKHDWVPNNIISDIHQEVTEAIGEEKAIIGFSGGVDSSTLSAIIAPILGKKLLAISINTGALRKYEIEEIKINAKAANVRLKIVNTSSCFQEALKNITDAEKKRKAFKKLYVTILEEEAKKFGATFIIQGSLATDYIESSGVGEASLIKSHHNIGNKWKLNEMHPIRELFKYEIMALAREMGLPNSITERQPFPGPGLFIRIIGVPATLDKLAIVKEADAIVTEILKKHNIYKDISQLIVALIGIKTVGIKGDGRSYAYPILIRGVQTRDFMTVSGYYFSPEVQSEIEKAITTHPKINRVWFDSTDKPPATTELE
ncbi:glutamine-hydrolyzing GMP synthase [Candidatus Parcubacteria bacterium]|nr:glutamine-hydrolyzing GMP synthase [Candidatus Parcubacteria bacterium]